MSCQFYLLGFPSYHSSLFSFPSSLPFFACVEYLYHLVKAWFESRTGLFFTFAGTLRNIRRSALGIGAERNNVDHRLLFPRLPLFIVP
jgi:hypothetical protein